MDELSSRGVENRLGLVSTKEVFMAYFFFKDIEEAQQHFMGKCNKIVLIARAISLLISDRL